MRWLMVILLNNQVNGKLRGNKTKWIWMGNVKGITYNKVGNLEKSWLRQQHPLILQYSYSIRRLMMLHVIHSTKTMVIDLTVWAPHTLIEKYFRGNINTYWLVWLYQIIVMMLHLVMLWYMLRYNQIQLILCFIILYWLFLLVHQVVSPNSCRHGQVKYIAH
jgi:hypothetical protein